MVSIARRRVMFSVAIVVVALIAVLAAFLGAIWAFQERIAFQPPGPPYPDERAIPRVDYAASDGQKLFAYVIGDRRSPGGLLIAFHGNADLAVWQVEWAEEVFRRTGVTVMLTEYRGYMGLAGRPSYEGSQRDAEAAYRFAREELGVSPSRIAFFGHSLGSAIATELASKHRPAALLLQSPFTSARDMAGIMTGRRPFDATWAVISRLHFDTGVKVASIDAPVSIVHGGRDRLIPPQMGRTVFDAAKSKGTWLLVPEASHNDVENMGRESYWEWISRSLEPVTEGVTLP